MVDFQYVDSYGIEDLLRIMELLRAPGMSLGPGSRPTRASAGICWREAYEAVEAIDEEDPEHLKEELGDVLLQVVFHARMAEEEGLFSFGDVVDGVAKKMVFRHPMSLARSGQKTQSRPWIPGTPRSGRRSPSAPPQTLWRRWRSPSRPDPGGEGPEQGRQRSGLTGRTGSPPWTSWPRRWTSSAAPPTGTETRREGWATCSSARGEGGGVSWGWTASRPSHRPVTNSSAGSGRWRSWRPVL